MTIKTLIDDYTFNKTTKEITFTGRVRPERIEQMLLITNVTRGEILYNFADKLRGGSLNGKVLTLVWDTSAMANDDKLQIFIDSDDYNENLLDLLATLSRNTGFSRDAADRLRIIMDNNPMLYTYTRNSGTPINGSGEAWYSVGSWNVVDARENLGMLQNQAAIMAMQRWTR